MLERFFIVNDKMDKAYKLLYDDFLNKHDLWNDDELASAHSHVSTWLFEKEALAKTLLDFSKGTQQYKFLDYYYDAALSYANDLEQQGIQDASLMKSNIYKLIENKRVFGPSEMAQILIELEIKADTYLDLFYKPQN